ncbi:MAG TPA: UDP-N-acetyl-D-mannosamine dehydrogenase [Aeromicrobium sp.]|nr:UDP-N-acetyl-D-mannosamine dehydrogenase [Aeromicrobium sp.]
METVGVIGLGYIGLPTAAILASSDISVVGVDVNQDTVDAVNRGDVPFVEPDLAAYVAGAVSHGKLRATTTPEPADAFIIAVPTPFQGDHQPDLSYIESAARAIAPTLRGGELIILESTSPPGATRQMADWLLEERPDLSLDGAEGKPTIHVAHCPERVLPGRVMIELVTNDRIVGGLTREAALRAQQLYEIFCRGSILLTDAVTAEMAKLVENSFRDVNIAFANELSLIADGLGIDVWELIELANHHPRVNILQPGPGVGGHCIAVDPWFIVDAVPEQSRLIRTAREVNDAKPGWVLDKVRAAVEGRSDVTIAALGLAFKPDIDDLRESPARRIVADLADEFPQAHIVVVEPHVRQLPKELANRRNVELATLTDATAKADVVVLLVDHSAFKKADPVALGLSDKAVVDTRGVWR